MPSNGQTSHCDNRGDTPLLKYTYSSIVKSDIRISELSAHIVSP